MTKADALRYVLNAYKEIFSPEQKESGFPSAIPVQSEDGTNDDLNTIHSTASKKTVKPAEASFSSGFLYAFILLVFFRNASAIVCIFLSVVALAMYRTGKTTVAKRLAFLSKAISFFLFISSLWLFCQHLTERW